MRKTQKTTIPKYLKEEEIVRFFAAIESKRDMALFRLMYHHGLRASEIGLIQLSDYRREVGRMFFRRLKGSVSGEFRLLPVELPPLRAWIRERGGKSGPLFCSRQAPAIGRRMLHLLMRKYCKAAGIPLDRAHPHALKHSCATHLLSRESDIYAVKDWLGHVSVKSTEIYAQLSNRGRDALVDRIRDWR